MTNKNTDEPEINNVFITTYTSGTEGMPKQIRRKLEEYMKSSRDIVEHIGIKENLRVRTIPTFSNKYLGGIFNLFITPLTCGWTLVVVEYEGLRKWANIRDIINQNGIDLMWITPSVAEIIKNKIRDLGKEIIIISGTDNLRSELKKQFERETGQMIINTYGTSENLFISAQSLENSDTESVGKILCSVKVCLKDGNSEEQQDKPGGGWREIYVKSPYSINREHENEYQDTGDIGYLGKDRNLYITGRKKEIIIISGVNYSPKAIEELIKKKVDIEECKAYEIKDKRGQSHVGLTIVNKNSDISNNQIASTIDNLMEAKLKPLQYIFKSRLERTVSGKIKISQAKEILDMDEVIQRSSLIQKNSWSKVSTT